MTTVTATDHDPGGVIRKGQTATVGRVRRVAKAALPPPATYGHKPPAVAARQHGFDELGPNLHSLPRREIKQSMRESDPSIPTRKRRGRRPGEAHHPDADDPSNQAHQALHSGLKHLCSIFDADRSHERERARTTTPDVRQPGPLGPRYFAWMLRPTTQPRSRVSTGPEPEPRRNWTHLRIVGEPKFDKGILARLRGRRFDAPSTPLAHGYTLTSSRPEVAWSRASRQVSALRIAVVERTKAAAGRAAISQRRNQLRPGDAPRLSLTARSGSSTAALATVDEQQRGLWTPVRRGYRCHANAAPLGE